ncbi:MAG: rRNA maturation RNase YbeY [Bacteroidales bacterium]|jgi:rRNA maturation RNase YbeY|nr:rRNA maturation RNase YbeY [Bacteroidales bacterium]MDY0053500.1 rRNA maturation RNase YbeY [Bacteroidales bacterium]
MAISFNFEDTNTIPLKRNKIKAWIKSCVEKRNGELKDLNYIFCNDDYILNINRQYLNHDYFTDIISFDYSEYDYETQKTLVSGDLFISLDTVRSNSKLIGVEFEEELHRVIIHGVLHLLGFKDKTEQEEKEMRKEEEECLRNMIL